MRADDFVLTATELVENTEERHLRAAVHAAYYGVYHLVASYFKLDPKNYEAGHKELRNKLRDLPDSSSVPAHIRSAKLHFRDLWNARRHADYVLSDAFDADHADELVEACKGIISSK